METSSKNKVIVVTGAAEGIGYEIADKYLTDGSKSVVLLDINDKKGEESVATFTKKYGDKKATFIKCDVTKDLEEVSKNLFEEYKQIDVLVNNAGIVDESSIKRVMEINSIAVMEWSMKFWQHMRKDKGGRGGTIINIASIYGFAVDPFLVFYKASKYSVMGFTRSLGHLENYEKFGVRVVAICPGFTTSTLTEKQLCWDEHLTEFNNFTSKQNWQTVEDVGIAVVEVSNVAESGSAWKIVGGILSVIPLVAEGDYLR